MNKLRRFILPAVIITVLFAGCGMFDATPQIESLTASKTTVSTGESVTFTIKGSTKNGSGSSDLVDYSGTIKISTNSGSTLKTISVSASEASDFKKTFSLSFSTAGTYKVTATLSAGSKSVTSSKTITVTSPKPWDNAESGEPYTLTTMQDWIGGYSVSPAGDIDWFKFKAAGTFYIIHWQDSGDYIGSNDNLADVKVSVYNANGDKIGGPQDHGCWDDGESHSNYGSTDGIRISSSSDYNRNEYVYIKVQGWYSSSKGSYKLYIF